MLRYFIFYLSLISVIHCLQQKTENKNNDFNLKPILSIIQRSLDQTTAQQQQNQVIAKTNEKNTADQQNQDVSTNERNQHPQVSARQQHILQPQYAPVAFIEPQFQYPGFGYIQGKQPVAR